MLSPELIIYYNSDGTLTFSGIVLEPAGTPITGATVTGTLCDSNRNPVSGWNPLTFADQGGGTYQASFAAAIVPALGTYHFKLVVTKSGLTLTRYKKIVVEQWKI